MRTPEWQNGRMTEWQNGRMAEWQDGRMAEWNGPSRPPYFPTAVFLTVVLLDHVQHAVTCHDAPSQSSRPKYTEGVVRRMRRCIVVRKLSRKCVQKKKKNTPGPIRVLTRAVGTSY